MTVGFWASETAIDTLLPLSQDKTCSFLQACQYVTATSFSVAFTFATENRRCVLPVDETRMKLPDMQLPAEVRKPLSHTHDLGSTPG